MSSSKDAYITFFASPAGIELLTTISSLIDSNHQKAENDPNLARDFVQRAKGVRDVQNVIKSMIA